MRTACLLTLLGLVILWPDGAQAFDRGPPPPGGRPPPLFGRPPPPPPPPPSRTWYPPVERDTAAAPPQIATPVTSPPVTSPTAASPPEQPTAGPLGLTFATGPSRPDDVAVIIGNAGYSRFVRDLPDVVPARNDAQLMRRYATQALGVAANNAVLVEDATAAQLAGLFGTERDHRGQLHDMLRPGRSRVFVYYSGHGASGGAVPGAYLVPVDADPVRITLSGYPLAVLLNNLGKLPATDITLVLEACFSGLSETGSLIPAASPVMIVPKAPKVPPNVTLITAGASDQIASWEQDKSHGLFTKYFLLGQAGEADTAPFGNRDGRVGLDELRRYLDDKVTYLARRYYGRDQTVQIVKGDGKKRL